MGWFSGRVVTEAAAAGEDLLARRELAELSTPVVVAGDSGSSWGEAVIRRAAELARASDAQLLVVHVQIADGLTHRQARTWTAPAADPRGLAPTSKLPTAVAALSRTPPPPAASTPRV